MKVPVMLILNLNMQGLIHATFKHKKTSWRSAKNWPESMSHRHGHSYPSYALWWSHVRRVLCSVLDYFPSVSGIPPICKSCCLHATYIWTQQLNANSTIAIPGTDIRTIYMIPDQVLRNFLYCFEVRIKFIFLLLLLYLIIDIYNLRRAVILPVLRT